LWLATSLCVSAAQDFCPEETSGSVAITQFLL
jgi:hypothetical protein